eukprot:g247.t1
MMDSEKGRQDIEEGGAKERSGSKDGENATARPPTAATKPPIAAAGASIRTGKAPTQWEVLLENLGNCLGGRGTTSAARAVEQGNGSVVPCTISTAVVRIWKFRTSDGTVHSIMLRHDHVFGSRTVELDGRKVHYSCGDGDLDLSFVLCGEPGKLCIKTKFQGLTILFTYTCVYENVEIPPTAAFNVDKSTLNIYAVCLPKYKTIDEVVYYKIVSERSGSKCPSSVWRCHSDFAKLHFDIESAFTGTNLIKKVPELPEDMATYVLFEPPEDEDVESTRSSLEKYLLQLKALPQTGSNPDLLRFLGIRQFVHQNAKTVTCAVNAMSELNRSKDPMNASFQTLSVSSSPPKNSSTVDDEGYEGTSGYDFEKVKVKREPLPVASFASGGRKSDSRRKETSSNTAKSEAGDGTFTWNLPGGRSVSSSATSKTASSRPLEVDPDELIDDI